MGWSGRGFGEAASLSIRRPFLLLFPALVIPKLRSREDEKLKLLPSVWGVVQQSKKLCSEPLPRKGPLLFEMVCVLGLRGLSVCVCGRERERGAAAASRGPVGEHPSLRGWV